MPCTDTENTPLPGDTENVLLRKLLNRLCNVTSGGGGGVSQAYVDAGDAATLLSANNNAVAGDVATLAAAMSSASALYVLKAGDTMTGALLLPNGAVATPSLSHAADANTGLWFPAADTIAFSTSGAERLRIISTGEIGIGTDTPLGKLDIRQMDGAVGIYGRRGSDAGGGTGSLIRFRSAAAASDIYRIDTGGNTIQGKALFQLDTGGDGGLTYCIDAGDNSNVQNLDLYRFRHKTTTGGVVNTFTIELTRVNANLAGYSALLVNSIEDATGTASSYLLNLQRNSTSRLVVQSGGNVGIGLTAPLAKLHVTPAASGTDYFRIDHSDGTPRLQVGALTGALTNGAMWFGNITPDATNYGLANDGGTTFLNADTGGAINFSLAGASVFNISSAGHLLWTPDNTYNIGAAGANRPANYFGAGTVNAAGGLITGNVASLVTSSVAMNDGAAAALGTLTNAPVAGNPTKWIPIDDNGTTRYIPAW